MSIKESISANPLIKPGRYKLGEAALMIAEASGESSEVLEKMLVESVIYHLLPVHNPESDIPLQIPELPLVQGNVVWGDRKPPTVRPFIVEAYWNDLNKWMDENAKMSRIDFRFPKPTASSISNKNTLTVFRSMDNLKFTKIKFKVSDTERSINVSVGDTNKPIACSDLGLTLSDNMTPNVLGVTFWEIARGEFDYKDRISKRRLTSLSEALKKAFGIKDRPFIKGVPRFAVTNPSKESAKEKAKCKSNEYIDNRHSPDSKPFNPAVDLSEPEKVGDEWLAKDDPEYGKPSSNYVPLGDK